ncbi:MAG: FtsX-like permease family protein [Cyclobacteriaceae bacterium]
MKHATIPKFALRLFRSFCKPDHYEELQGDLEEAFDENVTLYGAKKARRIYRKEILKMIRPSVMKNLKLIPSRISQLPKNYLKTSIRAIRLNPFYVTANIVGLALALSICTIGYFNYRFNATFNQAFDQSEKLYKIHGVRVGESDIGISPAALAPALNSASIPAISYIRKSIPVRLGKKLFSEQIGFTDPGFYTHFPLNNLEGERISAPNNSQVVISEKTALKLFNEAYPVGELITLVYPNKKEVTYAVADVFKELPSNTSFLHTMVLPIDNYFNVYEQSRTSWSEWVGATFVYLESNEQSILDSTLSDLLKVYNESNPELEVSSFRTDSIEEWPALEDSLYGRSFRHHLHYSAVAGIAGSALAILLLACFNFINTSIALSGKRLKEIAVRKILGGNRKSTITQFMIENTFMISLAVILSFLISYLLVPSYNALFQRELIQLEHVPFITFLKFSIILILIVTILSAAYPSLYVSKFPALTIFRNKIVLSGKNRLMVVLLTFQFALCFYNMFGLFLLVDNAYYQETLDHGYDVNPVINIPLNRAEQFEVLKNTLLKNPNVATVAGTSSLIGFSSYDKFLNHEGVDHSISMVSVGPEYSEALGLRLSKGSFFNKTVSETSGNEVIINQLLEDRLGIDLLNQLIEVGGTKYKVIGIVDNFNLRNIMMDNKITPAVIKLSDPQHYRYAAVRLNGSPETLEPQIQDAWYEVFPQELYSGFLQKDVLQSVSETNYVFIRINLFLGIISILISVLGLYTLISLTVQKRSKEFGVRKVLGASRHVIIHLLGRDLYWMLGVSAIIGLSASAFVLKTVLDIIYAYHISPDIMHFIRAILVVLSIVVLAIGYKVYQTGRMNPVQQLRAE